jgi:Flp pilus assembly pilin Flp
MHPHAIDTPPPVGAASGGGHVAARSVRRARAGERGRFRRAVRFLAGERGAATAEYAVATMAAVGFAGLLVVILRGDEVRGILTDLVRNALTVG